MSEYQSFYVHIQKNRKKGGTKYSYLLSVREQFQKNPHKVAFFKNISSTKKIPEQFKEKNVAKNNCSGPSVLMSKIQSRLFFKPKIIPLLLGCKIHSIDLLNSSNHLKDTTDLKVP